MDHEATFTKAKQAKNVQPETKCSLTQLIPNQGKTSANGGPKGGQFELF